MTVETLNPEAQTSTDEDKANPSIADRARHALKEVQEETEKRMKGLMDRGEVYGKETLETIKDKIAPAVRLSENLFNRAKSNAEWVQEKVEEAVTRAMGSLNIPTPAEMLTIRETGEKLEKKVKALGKVTEGVAESVEGVKELRDEVASLQKTVDNLAKNLQLVDRKVRKLTQTTTRRPVKGTKTKPAQKSDAGK